MLRFGICWGMAITLVFLVMVTDGHAQRLLETDGIELRGTARVVTYGAAVCNVLEEKYTEQEYEKLKANHGQPLNVWQLDFSVYNGSGKWLDHLITRYGIESKWPPCTNWSGDGPGGGPSGTYSGPVEWASTIGHIQKSGRNVVAPGATLTATTFIIAFHEDQPRFANWSVDFTFGESVTAAGASVSAPPASRAASAAAQQPAAATAEQENLFWQSIMNSTAAADFEAYLRQFPNGIFRVLAQNRLAELRGSASRVESRAPQPPRLSAAKRQAKQRLPFEPEMVVIPGGRFRMGCVSGRGCIDREKSVHEVRVESFEISKYEVTFEEYDRFTNATGRERADDEGWGRGRRPVINVSWEDAVAYVKWLSTKTGESYRLPTEAEREYAARAGTETAYSWGNEIGRNRANCEDCGSQWDNKQTAPVGSFSANAWGLHDMHGNVWEWVQDCWNGNYQGAPRDGSAWESGNCSLRILRGGSWNSPPWYLRAAYRGRDVTGDRLNDLGFRVARTLAP